MLEENKNRELMSRLLKGFLMLLVFAEVFGFSIWMFSQNQQAQQSYSREELTTTAPAKLTTSTRKLSISPIATNAIKHDYAIPPVTNGLAPVLTHINTSEKVVFLGIDDGQYKQSSELQMMDNNHIKASLFLTYKFIKDNPGFFVLFPYEGSLIEDHTMDHHLLNTLSYADQKQEICNEADTLEKLYGRRPIFVRPPGGAYNSDTQKAAAACGMKAVVNWVAKANGGSMQYQNGHQLHAGDIVLMHFRPEFKQDMQSFIDAENQAGLHTDLLENWLQ